MKNGPYEMVKAPEGYPGKLYRGLYAYEHTIVIWKTTGVLPCRGEQVHHKDGDKRNNDPENLEVLTKWEHARHHGEERRGKTNVSCFKCGKGMHRRPSLLKQKYYYCTRECYRNGISSDVMRSSLASKISGCYPEVPGAGPGGADT